MNSPTPRQQAGYLRRLLRRGELRVIDPATGHRVPALVEVRRKLIYLMPVLDMAERPDASQSAEVQRWSAIHGRLRDCMSLDEAEELLEAIELERTVRSA